LELRIIEITSKSKFQNYRGADPMEVQEEAVLEKLCINGLGPVRAL